MACEGYFFPQIYNNFYGAPKRFTEIVRSGSHEHAATGLYNYLVTGAQVYMHDATKLTPPVPMCEPLHARATQQLLHISSLLREHNKCCWENNKPHMVVSPMSQGTKSFWWKLANQGIRKLRSNAGTRGDPPKERTSAKRSLTHGLRTPRDKYPGAKRQTRAADSCLSLCGCRAMNRPHPEPPPAAAHVVQVRTRRRGRTGPVSPCHVHSLHDEPLQLVCAYLGDVHSLPLLLSGKILLFRAMSFVRPSEVYWTRLLRLFQWTLRLTTLISCPTFQAETGGLVQGPSASRQGYGPCTMSALGQKIKTNLLPVPNSQLLVKYKSKEHKAVMKAREVLTQDKHPFRRMGKLIGRCLSLVCKEAIAVMGANGIVAMNDILHPIRAWLSHLHDPPWGHEYRSIEFDIREMFLEIHRED